MNYEGTRATRGLLVTTSSFSKDAQKFAKPLEFRLTLTDHAALLDWIVRVAGKSTTTDT